MRRLIATAVVAGALLAPALTQAVSVDELRRQIGTLLAQIAQIQEQIKSLNMSAGTDAASPASVAPANAACPLIVRQLARGSRGDDVSMLQKFLVAQGILSADSATGYYGALTESAVREWQTKSGIVSSGSAASNGFGAVGMRTRAAIRAACGGESAPTNDVLSVSSRGLNVSVDATVNARGSCDAALYTLDFGDNSLLQTITVATSTCHSLTQTFEHTYAAGGKYIISLSYRDVKITVPLTVSGVASSNAGNSACIAPAFSTDVIPGGAVGAPWTLPLFSSSSGDLPVVSATGTPPGVALQNQIQVSAKTGSTTRGWILAGTPTTAGTYSVTITAQNACGKATRTISLPVSARTSNTSCAVFQVPQCSNGTLQWLGTDSNGCGLGYQCISVPAPSCILPAILCPVGQHVVTNGCSKSCVKDDVSSTCPQYMPVLCPSGEHLAGGAYNSSTGCYGAPQCVAD